MGADASDCGWQEGEEVEKTEGAVGEAAEKSKGGGGGGVEAASLDSLLQRLPSCVSRELIDQSTVRSYF